MWVKGKFIFNKKIIGQGGLAKLGIKKKILIA